MRRYRKQLFENFQDENFNPDTRYELAYKRVKRIKGFYIHLLVYVLVNGYVLVSEYDKNVLGNGISFIETFSGAFFWGIGLIAHGLSVFGGNLFFSSDWEEKKIKEFMDKENENKNRWQ